MKKVIKIFLIVISTIVTIIILDTLQALLFNNDPIIGNETNCRTKEGILVETYHCGNNTKITKFKKNNSCDLDIVCVNNLEEEIKDNFEKMLQVNSGISSNTYDYIQNEYYNNIINMGINAVPLLTTMYENNYFTKNGLDANIVVIIIEEITGCHIKEKYNLTYTKPEEFFNLWKDYNCGLFK